MVSSDGPNTSWIGSSSAGTRGKWHDAVCQEDYDDNSMGVLISGCSCACERVKPLTVHLSGVHARIPAPAQANFLPWRAPGGLCAPKAAQKHLSTLGEDKRYLKCQFLTPVLDYFCVKIIDRYGKSQNFRTSLDHYNCFYFLKPIFRRLARVKVMIQH